MTRKRNDWLAGMLIVLVLLVSIFVLSFLASHRRSGKMVRIASGGQKVAVVELWGTIYNANRIVRELKLFGEQKTIKAIVLRIDSPGGAVASAQEIYNAVRRVRDAGKPIVISMGNVAASGGYYAACGGDTIMANAGTTTGSIGVIVEIPSIEKLLEKLGIQVDVVKSGLFKDTGSPHRPLSEEEKAYLQSWVNDAYLQFVEVVARERRMPRRRVLELADGRVFTGKQAKAAGLVDVLGDFEDAVDLAARMGGIKGKPTVVKMGPRRITVFDLLLQESEHWIRGTNRAHLMYKMAF